MQRPAAETGCCAPVGRKELEWVLTTEAKGMDISQLPGVFCREDQQNLAMCFEGGEGKGGINHDSFVMPSCIF